MSNPKIFFFIEISARIQKMHIAFSRLDFEFKNFQIFIKFQKFQFSSSYSLRSCQIVNTKQ